jgi:hypothetical protein
VSGVIGSGVDVAVDVAVVAVVVVAAAGSFGRRGCRASGDAVQRQDEETSSEARRARAADLATGCRIWKLGAFAANMLAASLPLASAKGSRVARIGPEHPPYIRDASPLRSHGDLWKQPRFRQIIGPASDRVARPDALTMPDEFAGEPRLSR